MRARLAGGVDARAAVVQRASGLGCHGGRAMPADSSLAGLMRLRAAVVLVVVPTWSAGTRPLVVDAPTG